MFEPILIPFIPIIILIFNYSDFNAYLGILLPVILLTVRDSFIFILINLTSDSTENLFHRVRNVLCCTLMFNILRDHEHYQEDLINNYYFLPLLLLMYYVPIYSKQEKAFELDIIYRYFAVFYFRNMYESIILVYIVQNLFYAQAFGLDVRDNIIYSIISYFFGVIPCIVIKIFKII